MSDSTDNQEIENHCNSESETSLKKATEKQKVDILLKPTGNAPIMKTKKWTVDSDKPIGWIIEFVKKYLKLDSSEKLFIYVNQTFAPSPDQTVRNLYNCYCTEGKLVLHYCTTQAWG
ncbi:autophagy protein 12-like isoform X1 [Euwallacea fornicatus]|uniref:autophagy protein 12-like isoform X1 n=1 Tax=Euwallacea fornicatus TaxID=995702 RepID=UPI00338D533E